MSARITDFELIVSLSDGRRIATPLAWYPALLAASQEQRACYKLSPFGLHWPDLDEDLSIEGMLRGEPACDREPERLSTTVKGTIELDPAQRESFARWNVAADNDNRGVPFWDRSADAL